MASPGSRGVLLIYIGGYGRSGSTLLETFMTASPHVLACGETAALLRDQGKKRDCSCGESPSVCRVWAPIVGSSGLIPNLNHKELDLILLRGAAGDGRSAMVDSSKTAWRDVGSPFTLRRTLGEDFRMVHLVRDPRAVCWSIVREETKRANRKKIKVNAFRLYLGSTLGWIIAHAACELFGRLHPKAYTRVRAVRDRIAGRNSHAVRAKHRR